MTKEELDQARWGCSEETRRARLLYCMDYIMHALNDEEAIEPWLFDGVEDGLCQSAPEPPAHDYEDVCAGMSQVDFDEMVGLFISTLALEGGYAPDERMMYQVGRAVLS